MIELWIRLVLSKKMCLRAQAAIHLYVVLWSFLCLYWPSIQGHVADTVGQSTTSVALRHDRLWIHPWFPFCPRHRPQTFSPNCHSLTLHSPSHPPTPDCTQSGHALNRKPPSAVTAVTGPVSNKLLLRSLNPLKISHPHRRVPASESKRKV